MWARVNSITISHLLPGTNLANWAQNLAIQAKADVTNYLIRVVLANLDLK